MNDKYLFEDIGSFELTQPNMRVSDPCYDKNVWCSLVLHKCRPGTWNAAAAKVDSPTWGTRVAALAVCHSDFPSLTKFEKIGTILPDGVVKIRKTAGVDSGQCGFFDESFYRDNDICKDMDLSVDYGEPWYNLCCETTLDGKMCGIIPHGAVSRSGVGDGAYPLYYIIKDRQVVAAMLQFMEYDE